jgi:segregation and condensation protein B
MNEWNDVERAVEAMVFASSDAIDPKTLAGRLGGDIEAQDVRLILHRLSERHIGSGMELVERGGKWLFQTPADMAYLLRQEQEDTRKMSRAALEVLAIIAYHEPVSRAEIEAIRGVQTSKGTLDVLMEAEWVTPAGRREVPGRPLVYKTTAMFLIHFGLNSRRDLPGIEDLRAAGLLEPVNLAADDGLSQVELAKVNEGD